MLRICVAPSEKAALVRVVGSVEPGDSAAAFTLMNEVILRDYDHALVDLGECVNMDSTFVGMLLVMHERYTKKKGSFCLVNVGEQNLRTLRILGIPKIVPMKRFDIEGTPECVEMDMAAFQGSDAKKIKIMETAHRALAAASKENAEKFGAFLRLLESEMGQ